jgi:fatty acid desaturase
MIPSNAIFDDLAEFRRLLREQRAPYPQLLKLTLWRPLLGISVDWLTTLLAIAAVVHISWWLAPLAVVIIANRQRALGNILHDAGHRNLHRTPWVNDIITNLLVAPLMFGNLSSYRDAHIKHHLHLGDSERDPDFLPATEHRPAEWAENYARHVLSLKSWWGSVGGHLVTGQVTLFGRLYIVAWWSLFAWALNTLEGPDYLAAFAVLWFVARGTLFHLITIFREMCDHFGLRSGGVISFTRDILRHGVWYALIHPRNNGYHLTHHLLPAVPYYRLPEAQKVFSAMPVYQQRGQAFSSYFLGTNPVVAAWRTGGGF